MQCHTMQQHAAGARQVIKGGCAVKWWRAARRHAEPGCRPCCTVSVRSVICRAVSAAIHFMVGVLQIPNRKQA
eukprot:351254-Chlamydomonas_euryale.AAC.1